LVFAVSGANPRETVDSIRAAVPDATILTDDSMLAATFYGGVFSDFRGWLVPLLAGDLVYHRFPEAIELSCSIYPDARAHVCDVALRLAGRRRMARAPETLEAILGGDIPMRGIVHHDAWVAVEEQWPPGFDPDAGRLGLGLLVIKVALCGLEFAHVGQALVVCHEAPGIVRSGYVRSVVEEYKCR